MAYVYPSDVTLDYQTCRYGTSKLTFRGPKHDLVRPYYVTLGGTETYGKFVEEPFPNLLSAGSGMPVVNLGCMNAGPDVFLKDPEVLDITSGAALTIVQVVGAANLSNPFYAVHPRRNDRFLRANPSLQNMYRDVDFTEFHFTRHMLQTLFQVSPHRFVAVAAQLQAVWVERMIQLLRSIQGKTLLLWMSHHAPCSPRADANPYADPVLVHAGMVNQVRQHASAYMEVVTSDDANHEGVENMVFSGLERHAAEGVPGPLAHKEVADALSEGINQLLAA
ncbi:hypothetical protein EOK75_15165 (plasmid) [Pseudorhodobacter turbinis]|uniref:DUF6473 domain-containing protein n=2 Tax=Pseudorhodobacter turbinis TaxID=2500533 RepID=A0A4P8EM81_9RHOB|nr:hypothetical protein EOK75_15165 [Pseudorhodobacter turbinis]